MIEDIKRRVKHLPEPKMANVLANDLELLTLAPTIFVEIWLLIDSLCRPLVIIEHASRKTTASAITIARVS